MKMYEIDQIQELIRKNVRKAIDATGLKDSQIADLMNIESSSLSRAITGSRGFGIEMLAKLANATHKTMEFFFSDDAEETTFQQHDLSSNDEYIEVPVFDVSVSAGYGVEPIKDEDIQEMRLLSRSFLPRKNGEYHILFVDGDSMIPTLKPQDPVLVDVSIKDIVSPGIYVLRINGGLFIKRVDLHPDGTVMVTSDNKAYKDFMIRMGENIKLDVLGKAVLNFQLL